MILYAHRLVIISGVGIINMMPDGHMHTGWLRSFGVLIHYMNDEGLRVTGWQTIAGKRMDLCRMGIDIVMDGYHLEVPLLYDADGHMHTCWLSFGSTYYYLNNNGMSNRLQKILIGNTLFRPKWSKER